MLIKAFFAGWVKPANSCWVSFLNPTYSSCMPMRRSYLRANPTKTSIRLREYYFATVNKRNEALPARPASKGKFPKAGSPACPGGNRRCEARGR